MRAGECLGRAHPLVGMTAPSQAPGKELSWKVLPWARHLARALPAAHQGL